ncbi:MAG: hypothetical protein GWN94_17300 [Phycisphaerae bacterium]|nr:hypothetical protein [Phycisphaerae bacterium]
MKAYIIALTIALAAYSVYAKECHVLTIVLGGRRGNISFTMQIYRI